MESTNQSDLTANFKTALASRLPEGILDEEGKLKFDNLLLLSKMVYEHLKELETQRYFEILGKRHHMHVRKNKDAPCAIDQEYLAMIVTNIQQDRSAHVEVLTAACEVLNKVS